jgi:hypothetical protein
VADEFVDCRRKDDHSHTHRIPVSALPHFPDWEPIPGQEAEPSEEAAAAEGETHTPANPAAADPADTTAGKDATSKTAPKTAAKTTDKGRGE